MARSFGRRRTRSGPAGSGIRHLRRGLVPTSRPIRPSSSRSSATGKRERNRRITRWAQELLADLAQRDGPEVERAFVVHSHDVRRAVARSLHRSQRAHARLDLYGASAHRECRSRRSCALILRCGQCPSQWSYDLPMPRDTANAARIKRTPVLQIVNGADTLCRPRTNPQSTGPWPRPTGPCRDSGGDANYYWASRNSLTRCIDAVASGARRAGARAQ